MSIIFKGSTSLIDFFVVAAGCDMAFIRDECGTAEGGGQTEKQGRADSFSGNLLELFKDRCSLLYIFFHPDTKLNFEELSPGNKL